MIRDRIVIGIATDKIREKLFNEGSELTQEKAINIARSYESSQKELKAMASDLKEENVHLIHKSKQQNNFKQAHQRTQFPRHMSSRMSDPQEKPPHGFQNQARNENTRAQCDNCGREHGNRERCPAKGQTCNYCKKPGHFIQVCRARKAINRQVHDLEEYQTSEFESVLFETIQIESLKQTNYPVKKEVYATVDIQIPRTDNAKTSLKAKLDTGAHGNVLPLRIYRQMFPQHIDLHGSPNSGSLESSNHILVAYGGTQIQHLGVVTVTCSYKRRRVQARFYVTDTPGPAIIGLTISHRPRFVTIQP